MIASTHLRISATTAPVATVLLIVKFHFGSVGTSFVRRINQHRYHLLNSWNFERQYGGACASGDRRSWLSSSTLLLFAQSSIS